MKLKTGWRCPFCSENWSQVNVTGDKISYYGLINHLQIKHPKETVEDIVSKLSKRGIEGLIDAYGWAIYSDQISLEEI